MKYLPLRRMLSPDFFLTGNALLPAILLLAAASPAAAATLSVAPAFAAVHTRSTQQFKATLSGGAGTVAWQVNGIAGGNTTVGIVSSTGLYTAPPAVPAPTTVTISAHASGVQPVSIIVAIVTGVDFYVSTTGKDTNPGTLAEPFRTISHAASKAIAGDIVYVRGGTYHEAVRLPASGSATAGSIVFQSYPGEQAIVDGTGVSCCGNDILGLFTIDGSHSYIVLAGFEVRNFTSNNVSNEPAGILVRGSGSHLQILNNIVHGITETAGPSGNAHGIGVYGTSATPFSAITLAGNDVYAMVTGNSEVIIFDGNVNGFTVTGNLVHDSNNIAIDATGFYSTGPTGQDQARNGVISANTIYDITSLHNPSYNAYAADGIYCDGCTNVLIERNLVFDCDLNIEAASENSGHDTSYVTIANNVVYGGSLAGISFGGYSASVGGSDHIVVVNNTLFNNNRSGQGGDFQIQYHATSNLFENNIVFSGSQAILVNGVVDSTASPVTADYNLYFTSATSPRWFYQGKQYNSFSAYQTAIGQEKHSHFENPGLISTTFPYNFDLTPSSPARNTGNFTLGSGDYGTLDFPGNARTTGTTISIGAYQK